MKDDMYPCTLKQLNDKHEYKTWIGSGFIAKHLQIMQLDDDIFMANDSNKPNFNNFLSNIDDSLTINMQYSSLFHTLQQQKGLLSFLYW